MGTRSQSHAEFRVLNYHGIQSREGEYSWYETEFAYVLSTVAFEKQLDAICRSGVQALSLSGLSAWLDQPSSEARLMLTFDDGHISHPEHAAPLLAKRGLPAVFFVSASRVGQKGFADWPALRAMIGQGFDIGAHGDTHVPLPPLDDAALERETAGARKKLEDGLGCRVKSFSVPRGYYSGRTGRFLARAGYEFVFTSHFGVNRGCINPRYLKRMAVTRNHQEAEFRRWLGGDLGSRLWIEELKERLRQCLGPKIYDGAALVKAKMSGRIRLS